MDYYAGMVTYSDGTRHVVVAGGEDCCDIDTATWIYDLDSGDDFWRPGPILGLRYGSSVQFGDTFLAVGGEQNYEPHNNTDTIWEFNTDPADEKWILRPERLKSEKWYIAAFLVPNEYATECPKYVESSTSPVTTTSTVPTSTNPEDCELLDCKLEHCQCLHKVVVLVVVVRKVKNRGLKQCMAMDQYNAIVGDEYVR